MVLLCLVLMLRALLLGRLDIRCRFCDAPDGEGHLFWKCPFPPLLHLRDSPEMSHWMNQSGWYSLVAGDLACNNLEMTPTGTQMTARNRSHTFM